MNGLQHNYHVRCLDLGVWLGIIVGAGGSLLYNQMDPTKLGLSPGNFGKFQAIGIASGVASILTNFYVSKTK